MSETADTQGNASTAGATTFVERALAAMAERDKECREVRPGTAGYQRCWLPSAHTGDHKSQDFKTWTVSE